MAEKRLARPQSAASSSQPAPPSDPCPICLQPRQPGESWLQLPTCSHAFHEECATELRLKWNVECGKCPVCRQPADALTPVSALLRDVVRHHDRKEYEQCLAKLLEVIALDENHPVANALLGDIYLEEGSTPKAKSCWQVARQGGIPQVIFNLGLLHDREGDMEQAKRYYMEAHSKGDVTATLNLGVIHEKEGDMEQAKRYFMEAHSKGDVTATFNLGVIHKKEGDMEQAKRYFMEAHNKGDVDAILSLGVIHRREGNMEEAKRCFMEAHNKGNVRAPCQLGVLHTEDGELTEAERYFTEADAHPENNEAAVWLGFLCEKMGKMLEAHKWYLEGVAKGCVSASVNLGYLAITTGEPDVAEQHFSNVVEDGNMLLRLGLLRQRCGQVTEAEKCYTAAIRLGEIPAKLCLATLYMTIGRQDEAAEQLPTSRSGLLEARQEVLCLKRWWREPAMCALIGGYAHLLEGNKQSAEALYAEARAGGLDVPPELFAPPPHFANIAAEWAATRADPQPAAAHERPQEPAADASSSSSSRPSASSQMQPPPTQEPEPKAPVPREEILSTGEPQVHQDAPTPEDAAGATAGATRHREPPSGSSSLPDSDSHTPDPLEALAVFLALVAMGPDPRPAAAAGGPFSSSASSPSASTHPAPKPEAQAPAPQEEDVSTGQAPVHQDASGSTPGSGSAKLPHLLRLLAMLALLPLAAQARSRLEELLQRLGAEGSGSSLASGAVSHEQQEEGPPLPAAVPGANQPSHEDKDRGESSTSSCSAQGGHAQLQNLKHMLESRLAQLQLLAGLREARGNLDSGSEDPPRSQTEGPTASVLKVAFGDNEASESQPSGIAAQFGASNASSSSSTLLPRPNPHVELQHLLAQLEELSVERNKRLLEKPPRELVEEQATLIQKFRNQRDPVLADLESPELRDKETFDVIRRVREQQLAEASAKLYLLTFNPQKNQRDDLHDRLWLSPSLRPILAALEEAGLPYELPAPQLLDNGELAPGEVHWTGVKMLVPVRLHQKAKDLLRMCRKTLWPRSVVVSDSTMPLVMKSLGTLGKRHASRILCDEDVQVHLLGTVDTGTVHPPSLPNIPKIQMLSEPPLRKSKQEVTNSTEAGSHYQNPRRFLDQLETYSASPRAATDGQPADDASSDG